MIRFLVNPAAGRGAAHARFTDLRILASQAGAGFVVSRDTADLAAQARRAAEDGVERLLVVGGDGTAHHAAQGLAGTPCALAMVPLGTGNDLAATLGVPRDLAAAVRYSLTAPVRRIDLIRVGEAVCIGYAGVGFDSEVARAVQEMRRVPQPLVYPWAVISTLIRFQPPRMQVVHDGGVWEGRAMFANACNLPRLGGGMRLAPEARIDDGLLDLVIVKAIPRRTLLAVFPKVYAGKHVGHPAIEMIRTRKVCFTVDREMWIYGGGEPVRLTAGGEAVAADVVPGGLAVVSSGESSPAGGRASG